MAWVLVLALVSAVLSAVSAAGEQRAASRKAGTVLRGRRQEDTPVAASWWRRVGRGGWHRLGYGAAFMVALLTSPLWLSSWALDAGGFVTQAGALHVGSISAVQPLMVTTLLFSLPLAALGTGRSPGRFGWCGAVMICAGLVLVLSTRALPATDIVRHGSLLITMSVVSVAALVLVVSGRGRSPGLRAALLSVAAGALFAVGAAVTKLTTATFTDSGILGLLTSWPGYALAVVSLASFSLQQAAYATGPLTPAITAIVITDPLVAYVLGVTGFGETPPRTIGSMLLAASGTVVLGIGVALLARSPLLTRSGPRSTEERSSEKRADFRARPAPSGC